MRRLRILIFLNVLPLALAFDWGDFHKVAVIFFSFFGPGVILGAIAIVAYFACVRSWYESVREEIHETHRSFHPWPPGSAKWQLQQFINGKGPPPVEQLKKIPPKFPPPHASAPPIHQRMTHMSAENLLSPGKLVSPMPQSSAQRSHSPHDPRTTAQPNVTSGGMNHYTTKPTPSASVPLEVYCAPSTTYVPYQVTSPNDTTGSTQHHSPGYTMVDKTPTGDVNIYMHSPNNGGQQLKAIAVRTTTTTRKTTILSPVPKRPYTVV
ncbi:unnamed protein product [Cylicocyclus nassatus]|uniref:Uncharacterized protein n=1 Tax=Cylicocyclus nassatus TaxID=53992 RepID=A0AA36H112_CYLNA|nr:unnamed protein product [Cylicocyclus nassatus]